MHEQKQIYSLRKLSVGLASVIVGTCFFISTNRQQVKADTVNVGEQPTSTVIQQDSSKKQEQDSNEQNDQINVNNSKTGQQQSTNERNDVENVDSNLNDTNKLDNATKPVESEANQKFDQVKNKFKQDTSIDADVPSSVTKNIKKIQTNTLKVVKEFTVNPNSLKESKAVNLNNNNNGGFDEATWGKLDVTKWQGSAQNGVYQLTSYTGDSSHVIVPNEADFEKAGKSTNGLQVGITSDTAHSLLSYGQTFAFSKTNNKKVKAIGTDWSYAFQDKALSKFDGSNLDVSSITNMSYMFSQNQISDLTSLANWNVSNVTAMIGMFAINQINNLNPLAHWDTSKVTDMNYMFAINPDLIDVKPIANWNISNVDVVNDYGYVFLSDTKLNLTNINNTPLMQGFLKKPNMLQGATFITNNADLVKATINKDLPTLTNTAKRTIVFNIPHTAPETIVQIINYKATAPAVQVNFDSDSPQIIKTYPVKESDWQLDTSKQNDDVIIDGVICFKPVKIPHVNGYKAHLVRTKLNPNMMMISLFALPTTSTDLTGNKTVDPNVNKGQEADHKKSDTSSSSVPDKANNSYDLHDNSKTQNDQPIVSSNKTDHTINVSAQAVDPTVEPNEHNVASQNSSTTSALTQQSSTSNAEQPENISNADRVVNDQTDDDNFADPVREDNDGQGSKSTSNWSKPVSSKITQVDNKTSQRGLNEAPKAQSVASQPSNSVIKNSETSAKQLPQTGESDGFNYSALGVLLGLNVAITAVGAEKKRKKY